MERRFSASLEEIRRLGCFGLDAKGTFNIFGVAPISAPESNALMFTKSWSDVIERRAA